MTSDSAGAHSPRATPPLPERPRLRALLHSAALALLAFNLLAVVTRSNASANTTPSSLPAASTSLPDCDPELGLRAATLSPEALGVPEHTGALALCYKLAHVVGASSREGLSQLPPSALAVRLVLSEVGPDRLTGSALGLREAVSVLQVVNNRLNHGVADPLGIQGYRPYPGCGDDGDFNSCANPQQFLGLATRRAAAPQRHMNLSPQAVDLAMLAWTLVTTEQLPDITNGATQFTHRCGGSAYGARTSACDEPGELVNGVQAHTGPMVLRAPASLHPRGHYRLRVSAQVDYRPTPYSPASSNSTS